LSLAYLTSVLAVPPVIRSISESYYHGDNARNVLVGFLFAIAAFLFAYNGSRNLERYLSKVAAIAAICIAMFPCGCEVNHRIYNTAAMIHLIAAAIMFSILAIFCRIFYQHAMAKGHVEARRRAGIYAMSGLSIVAAMVVAVLGKNMAVLGQMFPNLIWWCEAVALVAFGVSWLTASHVLPVISSTWERHKLFKE
jgi:hypothetical protein